MLPCPAGLLEFAANVTGHRKALDKLTASLRVDASKARAQLGWLPTVSLTDGLRAMTDSFRTGG